MSNETLVTSRFKVFDRAPMLPGTCVVCGSADKPVLDFGMSLEFHGVVYFCADCITEAALVFGNVVSVAEHNEILMVADKATKAIEPAIRVLREAYDQHRATDTYLRAGIAAAFSGWDLPTAPELLKTTEQESTRIDSQPDGIIEQDSDTFEFSGAIGISSDPSDGSELFGSPN